MNVWINGEQRELQAATNVLELMTELKLPAPTLLVEHNAIALRREEWPGCPLSEGDRLEIIRIVAGG
ncbi:MAG: Thiamine biosynthesis protein ThiS [Chthoniobacteraceae bacterium]|nr:Thiamine biosynthesis protein ThiS [Chthoniobacteraceae bacterium]